MVQSCLGPPDVEALGNPCMHAPPPLVECGAGGRGREREPRDTRLQRRTPGRLQRETPLCPLETLTSAPSRGNEVHHHSPPHKKKVRLHSPCDRSGEEKFGIGNSDAFQWKTKGLRRSGETEREGKCDEPSLHFLLKSPGRIRNAAQSWTLAALLTFHRSRDGPTHVSTRPKIVSVGERAHSTVFPFNLTFSYGRPKASTGWTVTLRDIG